MSAGVTWDHFSCEESILICVWEVWIYQGSFLVDLPGLRAAPTKAFPRIGLPLGTDPSPFTQRWSGCDLGCLVTHPSSSATLLCLYSPRGQKLITSLENRIKIASAFWHSDFKRASFLSVGVFDSCTLYWPPELAWQSLTLLCIFHFFLIALFSSISSSFQIVLRYILLLLFCFFE